MALKFKKKKIKEFLKDLFEVEIEFISALSMSNGFFVPMSSLNNIYVKGRRGKKQNKKKKVTPSIQKQSLHTPCSEMEL